VPSVLYGVLPELIRELRGDDSQVEVGLTEMITVQQLEALKSGRIDLAFGRLAFHDPAIVQQVVMAETLVAAMPATAPAPGAPLDAARWRQPLILYPARPRPSYADHVLSLFRAQGLQPRVVQEANECRPRWGSWQPGSASRWCRPRCSGCTATMCATCRSTPRASSRP
jgi:DNA-binding transcriptional LysR family regulator